MVINPKPETLKRRKPQNSSGNYVGSYIRVTGSLVRSVLVSAPGKGEGRPLLGGSWVVISRVKVL